MCLTLFCACTKEESLPSDKLETESKHLSLLTSDATMLGVFDNYIFENKEDTHNVKDGEVISNYDIETAVILGLNDGNKIILTSVIDAISEEYVCFYYSKGDNKIIFDLSSSDYIDLEQNKLKSGGCIQACYNENSKVLKEAREENYVVDIGVTAVESFPVLGSLLVKGAIVRGCQYECRAAR